MQSDSETPTTSQVTPEEFHILYSDFPAQAQELMDKTLAAFKDGDVKETFITDISPAFGTHIGPEAVRLAYILEN